MKVKVAVVVALFFALAFITYSSPNVSAATKNWTIAVYLDADNSLTDYADLDIAEMKVVGSNANINIIVLVDYADRPAKLYYLTPAPQSNLVLPLSSAGLDEEPNMASSTTLYKFMSFVYNTYSSTYLCVILWNHGIGWGGNNVDDTSEEMMSMGGLKSAFSSFYSIDRARVDLLGFDQCLMGEVAPMYSVKNYVNYIVASEGLVPVYGWEYTYPLQQLALSPTITPENLGKKFVDGFDIFYTAWRDYSISLIKSTEFEELTHVLGYYSQGIKHRANSYHSPIKQAVMNTEKYVGAADLVLYDLYDFTEQLETRISNTTIIAIGKQVRAAVNSTVIYEKHGSGHPEAKGISIYLTKNRGHYNTLYQYNYWAYENQHDEFLINFVQKTDGEHSEPTAPTMESSGNTLYINNTITRVNNYGSMVKVGRGEWAMGTIFYISPKSGNFYARTWNGVDYSVVNSSVFSGITRIITEYVGVSYTLTFMQGWNMFGLPLDATITVQQFLAETPDAILIVKRSSSSVWTTYVSGVSSPNDDFGLILGEGYFLYCEQNTAYTFTGVTIPHTLTIAEGWNLISYSAEATTASGFADIVDGSNTLTYRNPYTSQYVPYIESSGAGVDFTIARGAAFFIWDDDGESVTI